MGLVDRLGGDLGNSFRLEIGSSVTADENEMTAKSGVSGFRSAPLPPVILSFDQGFGSSSSGSTIVAMMQTAQPWHRNHFVTAAGIFVCFTTRRRSLFQREMGAILEIVEDVFVDQAFQMPPIENDHMVEQIPAADAYPAFRNAVLPWTTETGALGLNAETLHCFDHFIVELRAAIRDQVGGGRVIGKRLAQLLNDGIPGAPEQKTRLRSAMR
jgi:hypothetical protein